MKYEYSPPERLVCPVCNTNDKEKLESLSSSRTIFYYECQVCDFLFTEFGERKTETVHAPPY